MSQPQPSDAYANTLIGLYILVEQQLLAGVTQILLHTPLTLEGRQSVVAKIRRLVRMLLGHLISQSNPLLQSMITAAVNEGRRDAEIAVGKALVPVGGAGSVPPIIPGTNVDLPDDPFDLSIPHGVRSAQKIRDDITSSLEDVRFRITRLPEDIYKAIAPHGAIYQVLENDFTSAQAQAAAWRVFVESGITGFTDVSGRDWSLSAYVEMAVRTASMRAYNASHLERMHALGIHYFSVPSDLHPCPFCFPWQGRVLTDGHVANPEIQVDATIAEATAAGLFHPNCKHILIPVIPGFTVLPAPGVWTDELQAQYNATQKQRRLELAVRKAKRAYATAIDPQVKREAAQDIRTGQAKLREFTRDTGFLRQSRREQENLTDQRIKMPVPIR